MNLLNILNTLDKYNKHQFDIAVNEQIGYMRVCHKSMTHPFSQKLLLASFYLVLLEIFLLYLQQSPNFHKLGLCLSAKK